jgi:nicotinamidase-related amidase
MADTQSKAAPLKAALLVMDFQKGIADRTPIPAVIQAAQQAIAAARAAGIPVLYCKVGFREGYPEIGEGPPTFAMARANGLFCGPTSALIDEIAPAPGEVVVDKKRFSAFAGNDLMTILIAKGVRHLVLAGISTSGVVLSTTRFAADLDFEITILKDACFDPDPEVHEVLMSKVFPRQAKVTGTADWAAGLAPA